MISNDELRLRGRPDWSAPASDGCIEVVDFKTGRIADLDGKLLEDHVVQVQLYALMIESIDPRLTCCIVSQSLIEILSKSF